MIASTTRLSPDAGNEKKASGFRLLMAISVLIPSTCAAQVESSMEVLQLYYPQDAVVVTAGRGAKPLSQVAENMTIVTAREIEEMHAHTVSDILQHLTGVQLSQYSTPGSLVMPYIQGASFWHVKVAVDGVTLNNLSDNFADVGSIPVQFIERLEIIKGPASSAWGSALGGIINIITKDPDERGHPHGTLFGSWGQRKTWDGRAELSGRTGRFGYYLYGGGLGSDGFDRHSALINGNAYGKVQWSLSDRTTLQHTVSFIRGNRALPPDQDNAFSYRFTTLSVNSSPSDWLEWNVSVRESEQRVNSSWDNPAKDVDFGGTLSAVARIGRHTVTAGGEADYGKFISKSILDGRQHMTKGGGYLNGTFVLGPLTISPGIRYDSTSTNGDFLSPSFGITWSPADEVILRGIVARGFNIPGLFSTFGNGSSFEKNPDLRMEEVISYQVGGEANILSLLNVKTTVFRCDISHGVVGTTEPPYTLINGGPQVRQGVEIETRTLPFAGTVVGFGYSFIDHHDDTTHSTVAGTPRITWNTSIEYRHNQFLGTVHGKYIRWNPYPGGAGNGFVTDLSFIYGIDSGDDRIELFLNANNVFNTPQHVSRQSLGSGRWVEGGIRWKF